MKTFIVSFFILATSANLLAGQRYNSHEGRWETVPDNYEIKYNPHDGNWSYQPPNAKTEYNPHEGTWDWNSGHNPQ